MTYVKDGPEDEAKSLCKSLWGNVSIVLLKKKDYASVIGYCTNILKMDEKNVKALVRRGTAHSRASNFKLATADFVKANELDPKNKQIKQALQFAEMRLARGPSVR